MYTHDNTLLIIVIQLLTIKLSDILIVESLKVNWKECFIIENSTRRAEL